MARISGVNIPSGKRVQVALTYIFGIGTTRAKKICEEAKLDPSKRVNALTEQELTTIRDLIDKSSGAQSAINEFYGASAVSAPVWSTSNSGTFDLGNPTHTEVKTSGSSFTLSYNGAVAIIAIVK